MLKLGLVAPRAAVVHRTDLIDSRLRANGHAVHCVNQAVYRQALVAAATEDQAARSVYLLATARIRRAR